MVCDLAPAPYKTERRQPQGACWVVFRHVSGKRQSAPPSANVGQWFGDSGGHWEGNTLVIDETNFDPKTDDQGSREKLHLIERQQCDIDEQYPSSH
jgi:hypothetical protein